MSVTLDVLVDGRPLPTVYHDGRTYLPVPRLGAQYALRVTNHGPRRITALLSVDGLSVITDRPASRSDPGYIVEPYGRIVIEGWRRDRNTVAAFSFEDRERSHAHRLGRPENIGVIGLIAYEELAPRPYPLLRERFADSARKATAEVGGIGTGSGHDVHSPVIDVPFVRSDNRREVTLYYDTVENLRRAGVPVSPRYPNPFPGDF
jgi:hypothetical protein